MLYGPEVVQPQRQGTQVQTHSKPFKPQSTEQGSANFLNKGTDSNYFKLCRPHKSLVPTQLCCYSAKAAIENTRNNLCACVSTKLYLQKLADLPTPAIHQLSEPGKNC